MTKFEKLTDYAYSKNIEVFDVNCVSSFKGCCMADEDNQSFAIAINNKQCRNTAEQLCTLAEEIGHIERNVVLPIDEYLNPNFKKWIKLKNEARAKEWAIKTLVPKNELKKAVKSGVGEIWALAEYFDVSEEFMLKAILYWKEH